MNGWQLLESLAEIADTEPDILDYEIYALWKNTKQTICFKPQKINYLKETKSGNTGIFLETKGEE